MQRVLGITIFSLGVLAPSVAPAQAPPRPPKSSAMAEAQKVQRFDFDNDQVVGTLVRPDDLVVDGRGRPKHASLVEPRKSFLPEMIKSATGL
jgi:hypothetical protein